MVQTRLGSIQVVSSGAFIHVNRLSDIPSANGKCDMTLQSDLTDHTNRVAAVAFSPSGVMLATASWDNTVRTWDTTSPNRVPLSATLNGHAGPVTCVTFSPDGWKLVSGSADKSIRIFDCRNGAPSLVTTLIDNPAAVNCISFSADGASLVSGNADGSIKVWDFAPIRTQTSITGVSFSAHSGPITALAYAPDGARLATSGSDKCVKVWTVSPGGGNPPWECSAKLSHDNDVTSVAFSPDSTMIASGCSDQNVKVWAMRVAGRWACNFTLKHGSAVTAVVFSPDSSKLASGSVDGVIKLWSVQGAGTVGCELASVCQARHSVRSLSFSPDGTRLASASDDKTVKCWNVANIGGKCISKATTLKGHFLAVTDLALKVVLPSATPSSATNWPAQVPGPAGQVGTPAVPQTFLLSVDVGRNARLWGHSTPSPAATPNTVNPAPSSPQLQGTPQPSTWQLLDAWALPSGVQLPPTLEISPTPGGSPLVDPQAAMMTVDIRCADGSSHRRQFSTAGGLSADSPLMSIYSVLGEATAASLAKDREIASLTAQLKTSDALVSAKDVELNVKDAEIQHLRAELTQLQAQVPSYPLPVFDPTFPCIWNPGLFPQGATRFTVLMDQPSTGDAAEQMRHTALQQLFTSLMNTRGRYSPTFQDNPVAGFHLDRVEIVRDQNFEILLKGVHDKGNQSRQGPRFPEAEAVFQAAQLDPEKQELLKKFKSLFATRGGGVRTSSNILFAFHGTTVGDVVERIIHNGLLPLTKEDAGFFGHGCYTTPSIEYAAGYACGDLCVQRNRAPDSTGCWPVIMFAASVSVTYPVTRSLNYATPDDKSVNSKCKFFGSTLFNGATDSHVVGVSAANHWEASDDAATTDYLELVSRDVHSLLPMAVLWVRRAP